MHEFASGEPVEPYAFGDELAGGADQDAHEVGGICPDEAALHIPSLNALAAADGVIHYGELRFVPDNYMDEPEQTKENLKAAYGRLAEELDFDHLPGRQYGDGPGGTESCSDVPAAPRGDRPPGSAASGRRVVTRRGVRLRGVRSG